MPKIPSRLFYLFATVLLFICPVNEVGGQTTRGEIQGYIYESGTRNPLVGATVTVTHQETGLKRSTLADSNGAYNIRMLPVGVYMVTGTMPGYESIPTSWSRITVRIMDPSVVTPPPVELRRIAAPVTASTQPPTTTGQTTAQQPTTSSTTQSTTATTATGTTTQPVTAAAQSATAAEIPESEQLVNTLNPSRTAHF